MSNETIRATTVQRALALLNAAGAEYAVKFDGHQYGTLAIAEPKGKTRTARYPRGATRAHYTPYIENLGPGDSVNVPYGEFDPVTLASNVSAAACRLWLSFGRPSPR